MKREKYHFFVAIFGGAPPEMANNLLKPIIEKRG
jgi:hypothetical protein